MDMESFFDKSREGKPATSSPVPAYTPPLKTEFIPAGVSANTTGMGRSRRRKHHHKKTKKNARKSKHRRR